jgi:hypothetical protein
MTIISDVFYGYVDIDNDRFVCSVSGHTVTLLPAHSELKDIAHGMDVVCEHSEQVPEYLHGFTDDCYDVALMRVRDFNNPFLGIRKSVSFSSPIIVKSAGNASGYVAQFKEDRAWTDFDAIDFADGNINAIYNPKAAALKHPSYEEVKEQFANHDGAKTIVVKPFEEYTHSVDVCIDKEKAKLTISVAQDGVEGNINTTSLGSIISFIRLSFDRPQKLEQLERYYLVVRDLVAILTRQNNISFTTTLRQESRNGGYFVSAYCKINDGYENYANRTRDKVVPLVGIISALPTLIDIISEGSANALLSVLPDNNKRLSQLCITNVQDLCTALEVEYNHCGSKIEKDKTMENLKDAIKVTIKEFSKGHSEIDVYEQTTISSSFQYLYYTQKEKIMHLYDEHKDAIDNVCHKWGLPIVTVDRVC